MPRSTNYPSGKANHAYYRTYWGFVLPNLCEALHIYPSQRIKDQLHTEFKNYLGYITTANLTEDEYRRFLFEVLATISVELGLFIRSNKEQPEDIQNLPLSELWHVL